MPPKPRPIGTDYSAIHNRLRRDRGPARLLTCEDCGKPAEQWAYDHLDPDERIGATSRGRSVAYSIDLDHYRPLCRSCHTIADRQADERGHRRPWSSVPAAPAIAFEPGIVDQWRPVGIVDLRKPPEWTGRRRRCARCRLVKDEGAFHWRGAARKHRSSYCRRCSTVIRAARDQRWYRGRPTRDQEAALRHRANMAENHARHRERAIKVYGGRCAWCGSATGLEFDHPDNDGKAHRAVEPSSAMYRRISTTGRPLDDWRLQLLCTPCHRGRGWTDRRGQGQPMTSTP